MNKKITKEQVQQLAKDYGFEYEALQAVINVESSGSGFDDSTGKIKIQFEPHWFFKYTGIRVANGVENQKAEWIAFNAAFKLNPHAAMMSTSWGLMQVMGFNFREAGFYSCEGMIDGFKKNEYEQLKGACNFIKFKPVMYKALQRKPEPDWKVFKLYYNGPNDPMPPHIPYAIRLKNEYNKLKY